MQRKSQLICTVTGIQTTYQLAPNSRKKFTLPFKPVTLSKDQSNKWFQSFCLSGHLQICDSR